MAYVALQLAYHVGFSKVFLVGVDLNQSVGRFYEGSGATASLCGLDQYFERRILPSMKLMADTVVSERFKVYNLSATSRLPASVIPKVTTGHVMTVLCMDS